MEYVAVIVVMAVVFGGCYLVDKGFTRVFRNQQQHHSGLAVRLNKRYGSFGLILAVLGLAAIFSGLTNGWILIAGGSIILVVGIALVVYYMTFGVFYDQESFLVTTFGKRISLYEDLYTVPEDPEEAYYADMGIYFDEPNIFDFLGCMKPSGASGARPNGEVIYLNR